MKDLPSVGPFSKWLQWLVLGARSQDPHPGFPHGLQVANHLMGHLRPASQVYQPRAGWRAEQVGLSESTQQQFNLLYYSADPDIF